MLERLTSDTFSEGFSSLFSGDVLGVQGYVNSVRRDLGYPVQLETEIERGYKPGTFRLDQRELAIILLLRPSENGTSLLPGDKAGRWDKPGLTALTSLLSKGLICVRKEGSNASYYLSPFAQNAIYTVRAYPIN